MKITARVLLIASVLLIACDTSGRDASQTATTGKASRANAAGAAASSMTAGAAGAGLTSSAAGIPIDADLPDDPIFVGAGDIASCWWWGDSHTGLLLDSIPGTVFTLGDNVYQAGTKEQYRDCYDPAWGRFRNRTFPSAGNHDEKTDSGAAYYAYFGSNAGPRDKGYYSYDLGAWHIIVYNSNSKKRINEESEQLAWIRQDLAEHASNACVLAYGHHPRFSSNRGVEKDVKPLWDALYAAGADVVLAGHEHFYERFAPQTPDGVRDDARGIRLFIVGTGGAPYYPIKQTAANSETRSRTHGVLKMTLHRNSYEWEFIPVRGESYTDHGRGTCSPALNNN